MIHHRFSESAENKILRLTRNCQDLHDVAFDLCPKRDKDKIKIIDEQINELKREIQAAKLGRALGFIKRGY